MHDRPALKLLLEICCPFDVVSGPHGTAWAHASHTRAPPPSLGCAGSLSLKDYRRTRSSIGRRPPSLPAVPPPPRAPRAQVAETFLQLPVEPAGELQERTAHENKRGRRLTPALLMQSRTASIHATPQSVQLFHHLQHICSVRTAIAFGLKKSRGIILSPKIDFRPISVQSCRVDWRREAAWELPNRKPGPEAGRTTSQARAAYARGLRCTGATHFCSSQSATNKVRDFVFPRKNGQLRGATSQQPERARKRGPGLTCVKS